MTLGRVISSRLIKKIDESIARIEEGEYAVLMPSMDKGTGVGFKSITITAKEALWELNRREGREETQQKCQNQNAKKMLEKLNK